MKSEEKSVVFGGNDENGVMSLFCLWTLGLWGDTKNRGYRKENRFIRE